MQFLLRFSARPIVESTREPFTLSRSPSILYLRQEKCVGPATKKQVRAGTLLVMPSLYLAAVALAAYAPVRVEAFSPAQCSALSLIMSTSRHTGSVAASVAVSPQPLTSISRRDVLAAAPLIAAGAGALLAPPAAWASFSIGESLQFIPEGGFQSEGAMQWPARLAPDAVLPVGNACMPAVGFGV